MLYDFTYMWNQTNENTQNKTGNKTQRKRKQSVGYQRGKRLGLDKIGKGNQEVQISS